MLRATEGRAADRVLPIDYCRPGAAKGTARRLWGTLSLAGPRTTHELRDSAAGHCGRVPRGACADGIESREASFSVARNRPECYAAGLSDSRYWPE